VRAKEKVAGDGDAVLGPLVGEGVGRCGDGGAKGQRCADESNLGRGTADERRAGGEDRGVFADEVALIAERGGVE
jgi:hypothetical protein